ncbi:MULTISPECIES: hypothetical protein [Streptomyces]|uniref:Uncharacterized protein n=1 Tax=Streptomyces flaveolus TaxID=67297 RepID=A0ABV3ADH4_9ACTN|nr:MULTISPECIES: hypothetical protein [Streptomyces]
MSGEEVFNKAKTIRRAAPVLAAAAAVLGVASPALADLPGAGTGWQPVTYSGGQIRSSSTEGEARDNLSNVLHAWRGSDNDNIWISLNNGPAYPLPATAGSTDHAQTYAAPTVIWTNDGGRGNFRIFHTGKDGHIYQHRIQLTTSYQLPGTLPNATQVPNDARTNTNQPVAAAALPGNSYMLAWNSQTTDDVWTMYYDAATTTFNAPQAVPNARSQDAPSLAAQVNDGNDPAPWNQVVLAFEGTDFNVYMARQQYGSSTWTNPKKVGPYTTSTPSVALTDNGYGVITFRDYDGTIGNYEINRHGDVLGNFKDSGYGWTNVAPLAQSSGPLVYDIITGSGGGTTGVVWKQAADFRGLPTPPAP